MKRGISLIELVVAVGIIVLLAVIAVRVFKNLRGTAEITSSTANLVSLLARARTDTLASKNDTIYGVHLGTSTATLFVGSAFATSSAGNQVLNFGRFVTISAVALSGGGSDIIFQRLTGNTANPGTVTLRTINSASTTRTITILNTGVVY